MSLSEMDSKAPAAVTADREIGRLRKVWIITAIVFAFNLALRVWQITMMSSPSTADVVWTIGWAILLSSVVLGLTPGYERILRQQQDEWNRKQRGERLRLVVTVVIGVVALAAFSTVELAFYASVIWPGQEFVTYLVAVLPFTFLLLASASVVGVIWQWRSARSAFPAHTR
jgi:hypothetical protein